MRRKETYTSLWLGKQKLITNLADIENWGEWCHQTNYTNTKWKQIEKNWTNRQFRNENYKSAWCQSSEELRDFFDWISKIWKQCWSSYNKCQSGREMKHIQYNYKWMSEWSFVYINWCLEKEQKFTISGRLPSITKFLKNQPQNRKKSAHR